MSYAVVLCIYLLQRTSPQPMLVQPYVSESMSFSIGYLIDPSAEPCEQHGVPKKNTGGVG